MKLEKILRKHAKRQPFSDTISMILSNSIDFGSEAGGLISSMKYPELEIAIKELMKIAWKHGHNACTCGRCDYCYDFGADSFEKFIDEFKENVSDYI